jgi:hypothetical protein
MSTSLGGGLESSSWWREVREQSDVALRDGGYEEWTVDIRPMSPGDAESIDATGADEEDVGVTVDVGAMRLLLLIPADFDSTAEDLHEFVEMSVMEPIDEAVGADRDDDDDDEAG